MTWFKTNLKWVANLHETATCRYPEGGHLMDAKGSTITGLSLWAISWKLDANHNNNTNKRG